MTATYSDLRDRHVLITGGAGGIGAGLSRAFAAQGSRVSVLDRDRAAGEALAREVGQQGGALRFEAVELTREAELVRALERLQEVWGPAEVLINNAGWDPRYELTGMTSEQWDELFRLNVRHYFLTCRELIPAMRRQGRGSIVMTASHQFYLGGDRLACYTATKAAVVGLVRSLAREVGSDGIRVNAVAPGWVMTQRQLRDRVTPAIQQRLLHEWQALPLLLTPENLAPSYLFLASEASAPITRQTLVVDGGLAHA